MYDTLSFKVDQNDLPPQDVSEPKYLLTSTPYLLNERCHLLAQNVSSLHDVKICLHSLSYICNKLLFFIYIYIVHVKLIR